MRTFIAANDKEEKRDANTFSLILAYSKHTKKSNFASPEERFNIPSGIIHREQSEGVDEANQRPMSINPDDDVEVIEENS
jgi:hypothetical protein